jgi:hypothetical protein
LISLIKFYETYTLWSSSLCSVLQPPVTSYLLRPLFSQRPVLKHRQSYLLPLLRKTKLPQCNDCIIAGRIHTPGMGAILCLSTLSILFANLKTPRHRLTPSDYVALYTSD